MNEIIEDNNILVVIYVRVSSFEQATQGFSLDEQERRLRNLCEFKGYKVVQVFREEGISGAKADNRPQYQKMLNLIKQGKANRIISWKIDRLSRSLKDITVLLDFIEEYNCSLETLAENIDTKTSIGRFFIYVISLINQLEVENGRDRTLFNLEAAYEAKHSNCCPLGYKKINKQLHINEETSPIVVDIFNKYINNNMSAYAIAKEMTNNKVLNKSWGQNLITNILENQIYRGILIRHKHSKIKEDRVYKDFAPRIIDDITWFNAQKQKEKLTHSHYMKHTYLFKFKVHCPKCDSILAGVSGKSKNNEKYIYYKCPKCNKLYGEKPLEKEFVKTVDNMLDYFALVDNSFITSTTTNYLSKIFELEKEFELLNNRENNAKTKMLDNLIEPSELKTILEKTRLKKYDLQMQLEQLKIENNSLYSLGSLHYENINFDMRKFKYISLLVCGNRLWYKLTKEQKKILINTYIERIDFTMNEKKEIEIKGITIKENMVAGFGTHFRNDIFKYIYETKEKQEKVINDFIQKDMNNLLNNLSNYYNVEIQLLKGNMIVIDNNVNISDFLVKIC